MKIKPQHITLSQIVQISPLNPRAHLPADANIAALASSLRATNGPVQNLVVRPLAEQDGLFEVLVGRRRFLALQAAFAGDWPLIVDIFEGADPEAELYGLAEQTQREPLHPAEEVRAFAELARQGFAPAEIARDFGCEERTVRQRLALGKLAQPILNAWRDGSLTRESAEAFTASDDATKQVELFEQAPEIRRNAVEIRRRLRGDAVRADHGLARFVTVGSYQAAGGRLEDDLFASDAWLLDGALLRNLAEKKLTAIGESLAKREGWLWVRTQFDATPRHKWREAEDVCVDYTDGETKRLDEIEAELVTLDPAAPAVDALVRERDMIEAKGWTRGVKTARRKKLGVWLEIDHAGDVQVDRGLEATPEPVAAEAGGIDSRAGDSARPKAAKIDRGMQAADAILRKALHQAIAATLHSEPQIGFAVMAAGMCSNQWANITGLAADLDAPSISDPLARELTSLEMDAAIVRCLSATQAEIAACLLDVLVTNIRASDYSSPADQTAVVRGFIDRGLQQTFRAHLVAAFDATAWREALPPKAREALDPQLDVEGWLPPQALALLGETAPEQAAAAPVAETAEA